MSGKSRLQTDVLFQGLARPEMILGVSFNYFLLNAMMSMITFINTKNFFVLFFVAPVIHMVGYMICMREARAIELLMLKGAVGYKSWNNILGYHFNTNSYDVF